MKRWQFWLGIAISIVFLWFALRGLNLRKFWDGLSDANYWWLLPGVAVYFLGVWARAWRWHYLLRPLKSIPTRTLFPIVAIGYMGNNIYPARAGELLRAYVLRRKEQVPISASLATIGVGLAFDGIVMLAFVFINLPGLTSLTADSGFAGNTLFYALIGAALFFLGAVFVFLLMAAFTEQSKRVISWLTIRIVPERFRDNVDAVSHRFLEGLKALRSPGDVAMVFLTSIVIWLFETGKYWFVMHAFPFEVNFFALMLMNGVVNLVTTIPSAPGYIGTFDATGIAVLEAYNVPYQVAVVYTLVLHVALWLPITLLGAYYMAREGLSWSQIQTEIAEDSS